MWFRKKKELCPKEVKKYLEKRWEELFTCEYEWFGMGPFSGMVEKEQDCLIRLLRGKINRIIEERVISWEEKIAHEMRERYTEYALNINNRRYYGFSDPIQGIIANQLQEIKEEITKIREKFLSETFIKEEK